MRCPADSTEMRKTEREGIEIDYCPQCRGVWLDRGELEKIVDRAMEEMSGPGGPGGMPYGYQRGPDGGPEAPGGYGQGAGPRGYGGGPDGGQDGPEGGGPWDGGGSGDNMGRGPGPYGGGDRYGGPPQGERRRSIFDIFNF
jgi:uncharacterized protein